MNEREQIKDYKAGNSLGKIVFFFFSFCIVFILVLFSSSCTTLKPIVQNDSIGVLTSNNIEKFNGEYDILSTDTSYPTLAYALTFLDKKYLNNFNHLDNLFEKNMKIMIKAIDKTHLKITVYSKNNVIKNRVIKGKLYENYFHFTITKLSSISPFYLLLNRYRKQKNRIGLYKNGDLALDNLEGGTLLLIIMPTLAGGSESYNLIFKRRNSVIQ
jgi:hypothetical protein